MNSNDRFAKPMHAFWTGGQTVRINSIADAIRYIEALPSVQRQRLHWQLTERIIEIFNARDWPEGLDIAEMALRNALISDGLLAMR
jgi:hypothetical protein